MQHNAAARTGAPIDLVHLRRYTLGDAALEREVLGLFLEQAPVMLAALKTACNAYDWLLAAHSLKGSARAVGAVELGDLAASAEHVAFDDVPGRDVAVAQLAAAVERVRAYLPWPDGGQRA